MVLNVHRSHKAYLGRGKGGGGGIIYILTPALRWAAMRVILNVSYIVRDKVTRLCRQTTTLLEEKGEPKRIRTEVPLLASLTSYR